MDESINEIKVRLASKPVTVLYFYYGDETHSELSKKLKSCKCWSLLIYAGKQNIQIPGLMAPFKNPYHFWSQWYFVETETDIKAYLGTYNSSQLRRVHGLLGHTFSQLSRRKRIPTYIVSVGKRKKLIVEKSNTFKVHGHDLCGNYEVSRESMEKAIPKKRRIYEPPY